MLVLSPEAAMVVSEMVRRRPDVSEETAGLRLSVEETPDRRRSLVAELVAHPEFGDDVIETDGARVYVALDLGPHLADKRLEASSSGSQITFRVEA